MRNDLYFLLLETWRIDQRTPSPPLDGTTRAVRQVRGKAVSGEFSLGVANAGVTAVLLHCQRPTAFSVFSHARRRDNRVCYAFSHNGQVHAPPAPPLQRERRPSRERERERVEARWRKGLVYKCAVTELVTR